MLQSDPQSILGHSPGGIGLPSSRSPPSPRHSCGAFEEGSPEHVTIVTAGSGYQAERYLKIDCSSNSSSMFGNIRHMMSSRCAGLQPLISLSGNC